MVDVVKNQVPCPRFDVVAQDVGAAVFAPNLEIPVIRPQPSVEDLPDFNGPSAQSNVSGRLFPAVSGVAVHLNPHCFYPPLFAISFPVFVISSKKRLFPGRGFQKPFDVLA